MKKTYKILRALAVTLVALAFVLPAVLYVALSMPSVQKFLCERAESEFSRLLNSDVDIEYISVSPFNRVTLHGVRVNDPAGNTVLRFHRLGAGLNAWKYVTGGRVVLDYAEIIGMDARLSRDSIGAPLNVQYIIDALSPKNKNKPPTRFDLRINTVVIRTSRISYDVLSEPVRETGFDKNHITVSGLRADVQLPRLKNDDFVIDLRRLAFTERSGFTLSDLSGFVHLTASGAEVRRLRIAMPHSLIAVNDQKLTYNGFDALKTSWREMPFDLRLEKGSHLSTADMTAFVPQLDGLDMDFAFSMNVAGTIDDFNIDDFELRSGDVADIRLDGTVRKVLSAESRTIALPRLSVVADCRALAGIADRFRTLDKQTRTVLTNAGRVEIDASGSGDMLSGEIGVFVKAACADMKLDSRYARRTPASPVTLRGTVDVDRFDGSLLMAGTGNALADLTALKANADFDITAGRGIPSGKAALTVANAVFRQRSIGGLEMAISSDNGIAEAEIFVDDRAGYVNARAVASLAGKNRTLDMTADLRDVDLPMLGLAKLGNRLSVRCDADLSGTSVDDVAGTVRISDVLLTADHSRDIRLDRISLRSVRDAAADSLLLSSELVDACVAGRYQFRTFVPVGKAILSQVLPALAMSGSGNHGFPAKDVDGNEFNYTVDLKTLDPLSPRIKLPVRVIDPIDIEGSFSSSTRSMSVRVDAPYLLQGKKLIENTALQAGVTPADSTAESRGFMNFTTTLPTKNGPMTLNAVASAVADRIDANLAWKVARDRDFSGDVNLTTAFSRDEAGKLCTELMVNPGRLVFNDTVWTIDPARITMAGKEASVNGFRVWRDNQYISIDGRVSDLPTDTITLALRDVNLDYVFETLDIPTAMFGGNATGDFYATKLLTSTPEAYTPGLKVKSLTYNYSLLGDAYLQSGWDNATKGITLKADITQPDGRHSFVDGAIYPLADSLDLRFEADRLQIGFLKPYMAAFAKDVGGYATGSARLWGTFKLIDMVGEVYGEDVSLTLGITNTTYTTTDSVRFTPGRIEIDNITLRDMYGHTARLNGWVTHECFKSPRFDFRVTEAKDFLVYDMKENSEFQWYGRVFGDGGAVIKGIPGLVDITVAMATASGSTFTYVLSDALSAQEYNFITFRDRDRARKDSIAAADAPPPLVRQIKEDLANQAEQASSSAYKMDFNIDITPRALITLVMDPVGGDRIRAHGSGVLRLVYDSADEDLRMNGTYTLEDGKYNFTLQDIIIKDFTINPGSSISFHGDPYAAQLDLTAKYQVKANLTDLDETFREDKELNRTNVPVDALMIVSGDMRQPDISFDLDFPTLTQDTKRKVRSIVNTEEMMNRQIIYLLALNRFYTPDYMNATRGNELVSVASSTISSQLSNILGQLSDNWNIAPNFRSDRGDFSDMEFDVALSSHLLNNRLLLNGNLGYRDKSMNNNSFIGDFDIEYLLNRSGSLRLKAYNRYNDQNYYLKSALTTQGVGIVFKRDFDSMLSFLRPLFHRKKKDSLPVDSAASSSPKTAEPADTLR